MARPVSPLEPILPIVVIDDADRAAGLAETLVAAGVGQVEVTLRTPAALEAIRIMAQTRGLRVGAGTVLTAHQVDAAADAGASFVISPGTVDDVRERAQERGIDAIPGVATATEILRARALGHRILKLFPAEPLGGVAAVGAFAAVFPDVTFIPTGGIDATRAAAYLALPSVAAVGGSWMVPRAAIADGDLVAVAELCRAAVAAAGEVRAA
ncbi:MAG: bifunctional 4-hydroxy-2-oxoglutarate aldolase/2-dehydro-3-deoxy-phosphogluconate aldolase [Microbacterium sp.]|nr:bifunctional 4-hydroxy-2-oxoglutarate aldolase/2-dehydro-3-deoxy-phosphogluconate aldolase [Microbacterium sp.]